MTALQQRLAVWTRPELRRKGMSRRRIDHLIIEGRLRPAGAQWLTTPTTPEDVAASLRSGHRLTCASALRYHGAWTPLHSGRHEMGPRCRCVTPGDEVRHGFLDTWPDAEPIAPIELALRHSASCLGVENAAILLESVLARRLMGRAEVESVVASLPRRFQRSLGRLDERAESGTETTVRRLFERRGVRVAPQARIAGVGRVDLLVGDVLVIECDSRQFHTGELEYGNDRRRDVELVRQGFHVVRLTWEMVMLHWEATRDFLLGLIRDRIHVRRRRRAV